MISRRHKQVRCYKCKKIFWGRNKSLCGSCRIKTTKKTCPVCGETFDGKKIQIYCSKKCQMKNWESVKTVRNGTISRFNILNRDGFKCVYCGRSSIEDGVKLHVDHIQPVHRNGKSTEDNLITACEECNSAKHDTLLSVEVVDRIKKKMNGV